MGVTVEGGPAYNCRALAGAPIAIVPVMLPHPAAPRPFRPHTGLDRKQATERDPNMAVNTRAEEEFAVPGAPDIPGLRFRRFREKEDFPQMVDVFNAVHVADGLDDTRTVEE